MRFPRGHRSELVSISDRRRPLTFSSLTNFSEMDLSLLEKIATISSDVNAEKVIVVSILPHNIIVPSQFCIVPDVVSHLK